MTEIARPRGTDCARVIQVIETSSIRGTGLDEDDMCRVVRQYWDFDGNLLAENDPCD
ncbi:MAG: carboxypeptidase [Lachnospiraceae bacterium]